MRIDRRKYDKHHVPPRHPDYRPRFIVRKKVSHHRAYHLLFQAAKSLEDCIEILRHDWWSQEGERNG